MSLPARHETVSADTFLRGLWQENPVFVMLLGMCPVLAVTNSTINAIAMGLATTFVLVCSNIFVSALRGIVRNPQYRHTVAPLVLQDPLLHELRVVGVEIGGGFVAK